MRRNRAGSLVMCLTVCALLPACAARQAAPLAPVQPARPVAEAPEAEASVDPAGCPDRESAANDSPAPQRSLLPTLETQDPELAGALLRLQVFGGAAEHRAVGERYRQLGVLDAAHEHFTRAALLNRRDAAAFDALARIWRDWGFPHLALGDAHRAVYHAPSAPAVHNTLGTVLHALGHRAGARRAYQRALALDPDATYALNNLCYLSFLEGRSEQAVEECETALQRDPALTAARHNLALAHAAAGRLALAERELFATGGATAHYNVGVIAMAEGRYNQAAAAFEAADALSPPFAATARARARKARTLAAR